MIEAISQESITYNKLACYVLNINNKKFYSPVQSKIDFVLNKKATVSVVKGIILEVRYE